MLTGLFRFNVPRARVHVLLLSGLLFAAETAAVEKIVVLGLFRDRAIVSIDGTQRMLRVGQTSPEGVLLVSADSSSAVLEFDGRQESYTLGTHIMSEFAAPVAGRMVMIAPDEQGM